MDIHEGTGDENAIWTLIGAHFQGLKWTSATRADWAKFAADFLPDASLFPAARPDPNSRLRVYGLARPGQRHLK